MTNSSVDRILTDHLYAGDDRPRDYAGIMRSAIALNGSSFNAQRMMFQYMRNAYATAEAI